VFLSVFVSTKRPYYGCEVGLNPTVVRMGFVVNKVALEQASVFPLPITIASLLHRLAPEAGTMGPFEAAVPKESHPHPPSSLPY
jgi:hypothetical protein